MLFCFLILCPFSPQFPDFNVLPLKDERTGSNLRLAARDDDVVQIDQSQASDSQTGNSHIDSTNNEPQAQPISLKQSDGGDVAKKEEPPEVWDDDNIIFFFGKTKYIFYEVVDKLKISMEFFIF